jgi:hypothetical protein
MTFKIITLKLFDHEFIFLHICLLQLKNKLKFIYENTHVNLSFHIHVCNEVSWWKE